MSNDFINFDEICTAMHISRSDPIGDQKFENLKIWKSNIVDAAILKIEKVISRISNFDIILLGVVDLGFGLQTLWKYGKDGKIIL